MRERVLKIRRPSYFDRFRCIASACGDNCCIGWEIDIDEETAESYRKVPGAFGERLSRSIAWEEPHFILEGERCPFLNRENLCDIIRELGEGALCGICREHPRFYDWFDGLTEAGLGLCCEAAGRLIFGAEEPAFFVESEERTEEPPSGEPETDGTPPEELEREDAPPGQLPAAILAALFEARETAFYILQDRSRRIEDRLALFLNFAQELQDCLDFGAWEQLREENVRYREPSVRAGILEELRETAEKGAAEPENRRRKWENLQGILTFYLHLEPIDSSWPEEVRRLLERLGQEESGLEPQRLAEAAARFSAEYGSRDYEYEHLAVYFVYRYFMKCREDGDLLSRAMLTVLSFLVIRLLDLDCFLKKGRFTLEDRIETAKAYSKEIEYCEENLQMLAEACWEEEAFSPEALTELLMTGLQPEEAFSY